MSLGRHTSAFDQPPPFALRVGYNASMKRRVDFINLFGAVEISDFSWSVDVTAETQAEAIELAIEKAMALNAKSGMPPDNIKTDEATLRRCVWIVDPP